MPSSRRRSLMPARRFSRSIFGPEWARNSCGPPVVARGPPRRSLHLIDGPPGYSPSLMNKIGSEIALVFD